MTDTTPGMSAYPFWNGHPSDSESGISALAYFAARAPHVPQWDFTIAGLPPRPKCLVPASESPDGEAVYEGGFGSVLEWEKLRDRMRLQQWPWVWAMAVIRASGLVLGDTAARHDAGRALLLACRELVEAHPPCSMPIGAPGSPARLKHDAHVAAHRAAIDAITLAEDAGVSRENGGAA